jgi:DNA-binding NtrC family response regulator
MPETNGQILAERPLAARPSMPVVLMSGYAAGLDPVPTEGTAAFLAKPFSRDELTTMVARVLADPASPEAARSASGRWGGASR